MRRMPVLNLKDYSIDLWGVRGVSLSDSQNVAIRPYGGRMVHWEGTGQCGLTASFMPDLFKIYGKEFTFSYDTFNIRLEKIDSIKIAVETGEKDAYGRPVISRIDNMLEMGSANCRLMTRGTNRA
jgi:hypothetical protein